MAQEKVDFESAVYNPADDTIKVKVKKAIDLVVILSKAGRGKIDETDKTDKTYKTDKTDKTDKKDKTDKTTSVSKLTHFPPKLPLLQNPATATI
jgi:hypothetical protein